MAFGICSFENFSINAEGQLCLSTTHGNDTNYMYAMQMCGQEAKFIFKSMLKIKDQMK